jgi:asparagine synthase (glutamine-hydrolysing)
VKVLLTGEGADELFGGYWPQHRAAFLDFLPVRQRLMHMIESGRVLGPLRTVGAVAQRAARRRPAPPVLLRGNTNGAFEDAAVAAGHAAYRHHGGPRQRLEAELLGDLSITLPQLLNRMDKNAMQASVEARVPFLDPGLVSLVINLPLEARVGPRSKGILRDVALSHLPRSIALRPKRFGMLFDGGEWIDAAAPTSFLADGHLRDLLEVPAEQWARLIGGMRASRAVRMWSAEVWCRIMLEGQSSEAVERELWPNGP